MRSSRVKYPWRMGEAQGDGQWARVELSFKARIRAAMTRKGWAAEPMILMEKWADKFGPDETPSRQTFYAWFKADEPRIEPEKLFDLGDLLDVNPKWLVLKSDDMSRPFTPGMHLREFLDAYEHLGPEGREELIQEANREARKLLRVQKSGTVADPFKKTRTN